MHYDRRGGEEGLGTRLATAVWGNLAIFCGRQTRCAHAPKFKSYATQLKFSVLRMRHARSILQHSLKPLYRVFLAQRWRCEKACAVVKHVFECPTNDSNSASELFTELFTVQGSEKHVLVLVSKRTWTGTFVMSRHRRLPSLLVAIGQSRKIVQRAMILKQTRTWTRRGRSLPIWRYLWRLWILLIDSPRGLRYLCRSRV